MNSQPATPPSPTPGDVPQPPKRNSNTKILLIAAGVLVVFCCFCSLVGVGGLAAFGLWSRNTHETNFPQPEVVEATRLVQEDTVIPQDTPTVENTPALENTDVPTQAAPTEAAPTQAAATEPVNTPPSNPADLKFQGIGVSRGEMIDFFSAGGAFKFGKPSVAQGIEMVQGTHTWLCVEKNCAAVTLGGPQENLLVIAVVAPTDPQDSAQTTTAITLLMTVAQRFAAPSDSASLPAQILTELLDAQSNAKSLEKEIENNGYIFTETYNPDTHNIGLAITRPK